MTDQSPPEAASRALDPLAQVFTGASFSLFDLFRANAAAGGGAVIEGRAFRDCKIDGPALMLVLEGVIFEGTNFGPTGGDLRNILFRPMGDKGIGAIPVRNCTFTDCRFSALGITGNEDLLAMLIANVSTVDSPET